MQRLRSATRSLGRGRREGVPRAGVLAARAARRPASSLAHDRGEVIDGAVNAGSDAFRANAAQMRAQIAELDAVVSQVRDGGGAVAIARHKERGKMLARERVDALCDPPVAYGKRKRVSEGRAAAHVGWRARHLHLAAILGRRKEGKHVDREQPNTSSNRIEPCLLRDHVQVGRHLQRLVERPAPEVAPCRPRSLSAATFS